MVFISITGMYSNSLPLYLLVSHLCTNRTLLSLSIFFISLSNYTFSVWAHQWDRLEEFSGLILFMSLHFLPVSAWVLSRLPPAGLRLSLNRRLQTDLRCEHECVWLFVDVCWTLDELATHPGGPCLSTWGSWVCSNSSSTASEDGRMHVISLVLIIWKETLSHENIDTCFNFFSMLQLCNLCGAPSLCFRFQEKNFKRRDDPCSQRHKSFQSNLDEALASWCTDAHAGGCGSACAESHFSLFYSGYGSFPPLRGRIWSLILCVPLHRD